MEFEHVPMDRELQRNDVSVVPVPQHALFASKNPNITCSLNDFKNGYVIMLAAYSTKYLRSSSCQYIMVKFELSI